MRKGLLNLIFGTALAVNPLIGNAQSSQSGSRALDNPVVKRLVTSLQHCIKSNECEEFERLRVENGVYSGSESTVGNTNLYYASDQDGRYLAEIGSKKSEGRMNISH